MPPQQHRQQHRVRVSTAVPRCPPGGPRPLPPPRAPDNERREHQVRVLGAGLAVSLRTWAARSKSALSTHTPRSEPSQPRPRPRWRTSASPTAAASRCGRQRLTGPRQLGAAVHAQRLAARASPFQLRTPRQRSAPAGKRTQREHRAYPCPTGNFVVRLHLRVFEILLSLYGARSLDDSCQETYRDPFHRPPLWRTNPPDFVFLESDTNTRKDRVVHAIGAVFELASTLGRTRWAQKKEARRMVVIAQQVQLPFQCHERRAQCTGSMKALSKNKGRGTTRSAHEVLIYAPPRRPTAPSLLIP